MIKYGATYGTALELKEKFGTFTETLNKNQLIDHFPGTNIAQKTSLGVSPTLITFVAMAFTESDVLVLKQLGHSEEESNLYINNYYYKKVVIKAGTRVYPVDGKKSIQYFYMEFIALDPFIYDKDTGEALY